MININVLFRNKCNTVYMYVLAKVHLVHSWLCLCFVKKVLNCQSETSQCSFIGL